MSVERAKQALINAHNAGDVESARKLAQYIKSQQAQSAQPQQQELSALQDIERQLGVRAQAVGELQEQRRAGEITRAEEAFRTLGQAAGGVGDIGGVALRKGVEGLDYLTGGRLGEAAEAVGDTPLGGKTLAERLGSGIRAVGEEYGEFKEDYPRAAGLAEAAGNLALVVPSFVKYSDDIAKGVKGPQKAGRPEVMPSEAVRAQGSALFRQAEQQGGVLKPEFVQDYVREVGKKVQRDPAIVALNRKTGKVDPYAQVDDALREYMDQPMTLEMAKNLDETLGDLAYSNVDNFGKLNKAGNQYQEMQTTLRDMIDKAKPSMFEGGIEAFDTVKEARKYWKTGLKLRDVERIVDNADTFEQPANAIRVGFRQLVRNPKKLKGYSKPEIDAIQKAARTGVVTDMFRTLGSGLLPTVTGAGGVVTSGPAGAALAIPAFAVQQGAKKIAESRQFGRAREVQRRIAEGLDGGELAREISPPLARPVAQALAPSAIADLTKEELQAIMQMPPREARQMLEGRR